MKISALIIIILSSFQAFGQLKTFLLEEEINLDKYSETTTEKDSIVTAFLNEGHFNDYRLSDNYINDFHIIDFDADGLNDIVFYGYTGSESLYIFFYKNDLTSFKKIISVAGKLVYFKQQSQLDPFSFAVRQYSCCAAITDVFEHYIPMTKKSEFKYILATKIALIQGMTFPKENFIDPILFETTNPEYTLRSEPIINNETGPHPDYDFTGNVIAIYPPGSKGTAIATEKDSTGRLWYFVIMKNNIKPIKEIFHEGYNNDEEYFSMGWISSRFINELK